MACLSLSPGHRSGFIWPSLWTKGTYYIQYNSCREDPELPMETFAAQVEQDLSAGEYRRVIVDLRNNGGGSDGGSGPCFQVLRRAMDRGLEGGA